MGPLGHYDKAQLQRGFQVFSEVCSACHSLKFVCSAILHLGPTTKLRSKADCQELEDQDAGYRPKTGEMATRAPVPADKFPSPFANNVAAAAANNNAIPPDLADDQGHAIAAPPMSIRC